MGYLERCPEWWPPTLLAHANRDLYELTGLRLALIYLSLYLLLEIFHPTLFNADAEALEQSTASGTEEL